MCLVGDYTTSNGVEVELFGSNAQLSGGPATLAQYAGAALLPAALWYERDGWSCQIYDAISAPGEGMLRQNAAEMTRALAYAFEKAVIDHLEDWYIAHPLFVLPCLCMRPTWRVDALRRPCARPGSLIRSNWESQFGKAIASGWPVLLDVDLLALSPLGLPGPRPARCLLQLGTPSIGSRRACRDEASSGLAGVSGIRWLLAGWVLG